MNSNKVDKFIIIKDLKFSDFMKDENGNIKTYDSYNEALETCGIYEFEDVLICKIVYNYKD